MGLSEDEDDDNHFCLRCHETIAGLENYVRHRQLRECVGSRGSGTTPAGRQPQAEDFFSSLHLQSSSGAGKTPAGAGAGALASPPPQASGKWRSLLPSPPHLSQASLLPHHLDPHLSIVDQHHAEGSENPPPSHTGGKWKPEQDISPDRPRGAVPPPDYTRGKWGPAERPWGQLRKGLYWCGPCNRRLSSRVVYERHVRSELHFKRTNQYPLAETTIGKRTRVRTKAIMSSSLKAVNRRYTKDKDLTVRKKGGPLVCEACRCKVWPHLIGKHLVSHYHFRHRKPGWEGLILDNMESIVRQFPFQCGLCKFYTNTVAEFMDHWASSLHLENDSKFPGHYWCNLCKVSCDERCAMSSHMDSDSHREMVGVINRSVPVIIQKHIIISCDVCTRVFRTNFALRAHAKTWGHLQTNSTASKSHQEVTKCTDCDYTSYSLLSFQRHIRMNHGHRIHFCRKCDKTFYSLEEVKQHRLGQSHRDACDQSMKQCFHCQAEFRGVLALKNHIKAEHPERRIRCGRCGAGFTLKQELSQHSRSAVCVPLASRETREEPSSSLSCKRCPFSARTATELYLHARSAACDHSENREARQGPSSDLSCKRCVFTASTDAELLLHSFYHEPEPGGRSFRCPQCGRSVRKSALKRHVSSHVLETSFHCHLCQASFKRGDVLKRHVRMVHEAKASTSADRQRGRTEGEGSALTRRERNFQCQICAASFFNKSTLEMHIQRHSGKRFRCTVENCIYTARSWGELALHEKTHSDLREFRCPQCDYAAKTKSQLTKHWRNRHDETQTLCCPHCDFMTRNSSHLKRHVDLHTGQKPYKCPHCTFSCALLENLRKHVISSKLHPDKTLYSCPRTGCDFGTNLGKELKVHLVRGHGESADEASRHLAGLFPARPSTSQAEPQHQPLVPVKGRRKRKSLGETVMEQLPTLASVALEHNEEDVIFIEVEGGLEDVIYQADAEAFPLVEAHFSQAEVEASNRDTSID